jgi:flagellar hook-basal body complex protein FliE
MSAIGPVPLAGAGIDLAATRVGEALAPKLADSAAGVASSFSTVLTDMIASANAHANAAQQAGHEFASGVRDDIHGTMIAVKEADIELRLVSNVRNKLVEAFNDLWHMNV